MKKTNILVSLFLVMAFVAFGQKHTLTNLQKRALQEKKETFLKQSMQSALPNYERKANYLLDSVKIYGFENQDSVAMGGFSFKYLPDGKLSENEINFDFFGFAFYFKIKNIWDLSKNQIVKTEGYIKEDATSPYFLVSIDSLFYDTKGRGILSKTYDTEDPTEYILTGYEVSKYKTNFETADSIFTYAANDIGDIELDNIDANLLDAKGNITDAYSHDFFLENSSWSKYTYNANNQEVTAAYFDSEDAVTWDKIGFSKYIYDAKGLATKSYEYFIWDEIENAWADSIYTTTKFNAKNNPEFVERNDYDTVLKKWTPFNRVISSFDNNGNPILDRTIEKDSLGVFVLTEKIYSWWSFYKDAIATKDIFQVGYDVMFQNPFENGKNMTIVAPREQTMLLEIFDMNGKLVSRQQVENQQVVSTQFNASGQFIAILSGTNGAFLTMKKIVKL